MISKEEKTEILVDFISEKMPDKTLDLCKIHSCTHMQPES
jgi:hypothetical protein